MCVCVFVLHFLKNETINIREKGYLFKKKTVKSRHIIYNLLNVHLVIDRTVHDEVLLLVIVDDLIDLVIVRIQLQELIRRIV
jgi:hypothetical protein